MALNPPNGKVISAVMSERQQIRIGISEIIAVIWGIVGVSSLLLSAIYRLTPRAFASLDFPWSWYQWGFALVFLVFMLYSEGWRGFHQKFSPTVAARLRYLSRRGTTTDKWLAPLFSMGYFHATRRRKITSYGVTSGVIILIILVHYIPQPWRGIIDMGVIGGLALGVIDVWYFIFIAFTTPDFDYPPEVE